MHPLCKAVLEGIQSKAWHAFFDAEGATLARAHGVGLLWLAAARRSGYVAGADLPQGDAPVPFEIGVLLNERARESDIQESAQRVVLAMRGHVPVVCLKTFALGRMLHDNACYRVSDTLEVLIRPEDAQAFDEGLSSQGFVPVLARGTHPGHRPPRGSVMGRYVSGDGALIVKPQTELDARHRFAPVDARVFFRDAVDASWRGEPYTHLSHTHALFHLILRLPLFKCGLADAVDCTRLVTGGKVDWNAFDALVDQAQAHDALVHANGVVGGYFPGYPWFGEDRVRRSLPKVKRRYVRTYATRRCATHPMVTVPESLGAAEPSVAFDKALLTHMFAAGSRAEKLRRLSRISSLFFLPAAQGMDLRAGASGKGRLLRRVALLRSNFHEVSYDHGRLAWLKILAAATLRALAPEARAHGRASSGLSQEEHGARGHGP